MKKFVKLFSLGVATAVATVSLSMPANAACANHAFYQKYLGVATTAFSQHTVGVGADSVICTITRTGHACVDVCKNCGYSGSSYLVYSDSHSVSH